MASSDNTGPFNDKQTSHEHNLPQESLAGAHDEEDPISKPEVSWESDGTPSVDDTISFDGDVA